jgi:acyl CoA:acetate/3-ketoacid CoA transferase alpha subunit
MKKFISTTDVVAKIANGATLMIGGFMTCGSAVRPSTSKQSENRHQPI